MTLHSSNLLLLVTRHGFMNMTSKLPNNLANGAPKMSQNQKNHVKVGQKSRWCSSFSSITVVWCTMNSFQRVKRLMRNTTWPFWIVYVKQFDVNGRSSLIVTEFLAKHETKVIAQPPNWQDLAPCDFFLFPKLKYRLWGTHNESVEAIERNSLKELKAIPAEAYKKCMENWINRWHACIG